MFLSYVVSYMHTQPKMNPFRFHRYLNFFSPEFSILHGDNAVKIVCFPVERGEIDNTVVSSPVFDRWPRGRNSGLRCQLTPLLFLVVQTLGLSRVIAY